MYIHRSALAAVCATLSVWSTGQGCAPYTTRTGAFGIFFNERFTDLEQNAPVRTFNNGDRFFYRMDEQSLRGWMDGHAVSIPTTGPVEVRTANGRFAWKDGERLFTLRSEGPLLIAEHAGTFSVTDSLIAYHDPQEKTIRVYWRGMNTIVAQLDSATTKPQWLAGANTLVFHIRAERRLMLFHHGDLRELSKEVDGAVVVAGGDVVAYMDDGRKTFRVFDKGTVSDLEDLRPINAQAGDGILGFVSGTGRFKCYRNGRAHTLGKEAPSSYFVQDSVITWVAGGKWYTEEKGEAVLLEPYVPERWEVNGSTIIYLNLDRELHSYRMGERVNISREPNIERFDVNGSIVTWTTSQGLTRAWDGEDRWEHP